MLAERMIVKENIYSPRLKGTVYPPSILLISDDPRRSLKIDRFLTDHGCRMYRVDIRVEGLDTACQTYFDVLVLDVQTPQTSLQAWAEIETQSELTSLPIILLTGQDCSQEVVWQLKAGHIYCLPHNVSHDCLLTLIQQISYMLKRY